MNKCKNCGGRICFSPIDRGNKCENCAKIYQIKYDYAIEKVDYLSNIDNQELPKVRNIRKIKCNSCGANVVLNKHQAQAVCPYCTSSEIIEDLPEGMNKIDAIIPFSFDRDEAFERLKKQISKSMFGNKSLLKSLTPSSIVGIYANAIIFDIDSMNKYKGILYKNVVKKNYDGSQTTTTRPFGVDGIIEYRADNLVIEANYNINQKDMESIPPYNYNEMVKFENDFMNGYILEYQDKDISTAYNNATTIIKNRVKNMIVTKYNADGITTLDIETIAKDIKYNHSLLPIYMISVKDKKKEHKILMNGQTGKVNRIPKSGLKIFGFTVGILAIIGLIIGLIIAL